MKNLFCVCSELINQMRFSFRNQQGLWGTAVNVAPSHLQFVQIMCKCSFFLEIVKIMSHHHHQYDTFPASVLVSCFLFEGESQQSTDTSGSLITASQSVGNFQTLKLKKEVGQWEMRMVSTNPYTLKVIGETSMTD